MQQQEEVAFALIIGTFLFLFLFICLLFFFVGFKNSKKRYLEEKKRLQLTYQNELANATIEIQEDILINLGRELHDNIGQLLTVAKIHVNALVKHPEKRTPEKMKETGHVLEIAISELKNLSKSLNPDKIKQHGLIYALNIEIERIIKLDLMEVKFSVYGNSFPFSVDNEIIIFRIIQEFIANTIKYAEATQLEVNCHYEDERFFLEMRDDGKGFDMNTMKYGSGILNIRNRANLIHAICDITSEQNKGTCLQLIIPKNSLI